MLKNKVVKLLILSGVIFSMLHIASCTQKQESLSNEDQIKKENERKKKEEQDLKYRKLQGLKDREYSALARIYPESSEDQLTNDDIRNLNEWELKVLRNEIYAETGYIFKTEMLIKYFSAQKWYQPRYDNVDSLLTQIEKDNIELIKRQEVYLGNRDFSR